MYWFDYFRYNVYIFIESIYFLINQLSSSSKNKHYLCIDRDYKDDKTRTIDIKQRSISVAHLKKNRKEQWDYDTTTNQKIFSQDKTFPKSIYLL